MITRFVKIQLAVFLVIAVGALTITGIQYVGLDKLVSKPYKVKAYFTQTGNVFRNADVTYRGVTVGRVGEIAVAENGAVVTLEIENQNDRIPKEVRAEVQKLSAVGEQYVDLTPMKSGGPYLKDKDSIPYAMTSTPVDETTVLVHTNELVRTVPKGDLVTTVDELGKAFDGLGPDLQRVIDRGNEVIAAFQSNLPQTIRLIEEGRVVLNTQRDVGPAFKSFARDIADVSGTIRTSDGDLRRLLDNAAVGTPELRRLFEDLRPELPMFLGNLITLGQIQAARLPGLDQLLVLYPKVIDGGYATTADPEGGARFGLVSDMYPACTRGYLPPEQRTEATDEPPPGGNDNAPVRRDFDCAEPTDSDISIRGGRNAPRPDSGAAGLGANSTEPTPSSPLITQPPSTAIADRAAYDPGSGLVTGPDGMQYFLGSDGGQAKVLGAESWKHLFLAPLTP